MGKKNENFRKNKFRLRSKYILLTYSQTPPDFDPHAINLCVRMLGGLARIGKETHPNTGGDHYHCFAAHPSKFQTRSHTSFDVQGIHPNIQPVHQTPWTPWRYAVKDGNIIVDDVPEPPRGRGRKSKTEDQAVWKKIANAPTREALFNAFKEEKPRELMLSYNNIRSYGDSEYQSPSTLQYESPPLQCHFEFYPELEQYINNYISSNPSTEASSASSELSSYTNSSGEDGYSLEGSTWAAGAEIDSLLRYEPSPNPKPRTNKPQPRPLSLLLWGDTKTGKTLLARSLGKHNYFHRDFNLDDFDQDASYIVFDDIEKGLKAFSYKCWLGGQNQFVLSDKYRKKKTIVWGKPCIYISNRDPLQEKGAHIDHDWIKGNTVRIRVTRDKPVASVRADQ